MTLKKIISWLHLWLGLVVGLIFSIAAITGALLIYEEELEKWMYPRMHYCEFPKEGVQRLPIDVLFVKAQAYAGKSKVDRLRIVGQEANAAYIFQTKGERLERLFIALNPYDGRLQLIIEGRKHFFSVVEELHRKLLMGDVGKWITGLCCLSYLVIVLTGLVLWWPKHKKMFKQRLKIKWDAKAKRINWDVHAVGGFYTLPVVFVVAFTALTWSYTWFNAGIFYLMDGKGPQKYQTNFGLSPQQKGSFPIDVAYQQALQLMPYDGEMNISLPNKKSDVIDISREQAQAAIPNIVDRLRFNAFTGELVKYEWYKDQTAGMKVRRMIFPIHTGSIGGSFTKALYLVVMLFVASLPFTGFFVWLGRKKKKPLSNKKRNQIPSVRSIVPLAE